MGSEVFGSNGDTAFPPNSISRVPVPGLDRRRQESPCSARQLARSVSGLEVNSVGWFSDCAVAGAAKNAAARATLVMGAIMPWMEGVKRESLPLSWVRSMGTRKRKGKKY